MFQLEVIANVLLEGVIMNNLLPFLGISFQTRERMRISYRISLFVSKVRLCVPDSRWHCILMTMAGAE